MRALLTPEIAPRMGIVLFRPGSELMPLFMQGRVLLEPERNVIHLLPVVPFRRHHNRWR
ncbi:hypothetical protein [Escherichia coli]|uniref:hypothetical protein n=1 Tax=Escherichia coli TaxID=562 RepID=UPI003D76F87D